MALSDVDISPGFVTQLSVTPKLTVTTEDARNRFTPDERVCYFDDEFRFKYLPSELYRWAWKALFLPLRNSHLRQHTLFENHPKCRIWILEFWHFPPIFVLLKLTCLVTLFDRKLQVFKNSPKWTIFCHFPLTFVHSKRKRSSLRSQCWMRLFLWFSNTVFFVVVLLGQGLTRP